MLEAEKGRLLHILVGHLQRKVMGADDAKMELAGIHKIHADTGIGIRTLKRLFGMERVPPDYYPYFGTRDILCAYAGFEDWADFVRSHPLQETPSVPLPETFFGTAREEMDALPADIHYPNEPFRNLEWFRREDARIFYGRKKAIQEVMSYLQSPHADQVILVYGQSGVGKSSFLHAGLLPRLEQQYATWYFRRAKDNRLSEMLDQLEADLNAHDRPAVAILDQVEAVYAGTVEEGDDELGAFFQRLATLIDEAPHLKVLISFRKEYFAEMDTCLSRQGMAYKRYFLQPLNSQEIEEAVIGLTMDGQAMEKYELRIDPVVPEKILDMIAGDRQSHIAPTLQTILTKLWKAATYLGTWPPYFSDELLMGNIKAKSHFLGDFIDEKLLEMESRFPVRRQTGLMVDVLSFFVSEIITATERSEAQIQEEYRHIPEVLSIVAAMRECHLLSDPALAGKGMLRLAHDALAPLILLRQNNSSAPGQKARRILESRAMAPGHMESSETAFRWDEQALRVIEEGSFGMRAWTTAEAALIAQSKAELEHRFRVRRVRLRWPWTGAGSWMRTMGAAISLFLRATLKIRESLAERKPREKSAKNLAVTPHRGNQKSPSSVS